MELRDYIELGSTKAGSLTALSKLLDLTQPQLSTMKAHGRPMPDKQIVLLSELIDVPVTELIRANNIAMGKHVDFWTTWGKAASIAALGIVTTFVTPSPVQAHQTEASQNHDLYYGKSATPAASKKRQLIRAMKQAIEGVIVRIAATFKAWIAQPQAI